MAAAERRRETTPGRRLDRHFIFVLVATILIRSEISIPDSALQADLLRSTVYSELSLAIYQTLGNRFLFTISDTFLFIPC
jgi:hypothetical protein